MKQGTPMKWIRRSLLAVLLLVLLAIAAVWGWSHRVLPQTDGSLELQGLHAPIRIERDANGIPTIKAASADDALSSGSASCMRKTGCGSSRRTAASAPAGSPRRSARRRSTPTASCARSA